MLPLLQTCVEAQPRSIPALLRCGKTQHVFYARQKIPSLGRHFRSNPQYNSGSLSRPDGDLLGLRGRFSLTGKNFIVTGGGRGIGYAAARAIAESGGNVSILDAAPKPVKDFANLEDEFGVKTKYIQTDVTDEVSLTKAFEETVAEFKTLDGW